MSQRAYSPRAAAALVFCASGAVLVLEILAVRLLAPYVGLTLETTTTIIGTALAGIAAGAALGGRAADRTDGRWLVPVLLCGGGVLAIAIVPLVRLLGGALQGGGDAAALVITLMALFPSATVLAAVSPVVAKVQLRDLDAAGTVVGSLSAWATAGGLIGTFGTGFVLVPLLAVDVAVFAVGGALVVAGVALAVRQGLTSRGRGVGMGAAAALVALVTLVAGSPCDTESTYHCARVVIDEERPTGRTLVLDDLRHSYVDLENPARLEFDYTRWIGAAITALPPRRRALDAVFLGGGG